MGWGGGGKIEMKWIRLHKLRQQKVRIDEECDGEKRCKAIQFRVPETSKKSFKGSERSASGESLRHSKQAHVDNIEY